VKITELLADNPHWLVWERGGLMLIRVPRKDAKKYYKQDAEVIVSVTKTTTTVITGNQEALNSYWNSKVPRR